MTKESLRQKTVPKAQNRSGKSSAFENRIVAETAPTNMMT
jgi:hypothetical protein